MLPTVPTVPESDRFRQSQYVLVVGSDMPLPGDLVVAYGPYCVG